MSTTAAPSYRQLLAPTGVRSLAFGSLLGRTSSSMLSVGAVLLIGGAYSFALAGMALGAYALATVLAGPLRSWFVVRLGDRRAILALGLLCATGVVGVVAASSVAAPEWVPTGAIVIAGVSAPPFGALLRVAWCRRLPDEWTPSAFGLDSVMEEGSFILGPLVAAIFIGLSGPSAAVIAAAALCALAAVVMALASGYMALAQDGEVEHLGEHNGLLAVASSLRWLLFITFGVGVSVGAIELLVPALASLGGQPWIAGALFAAWGAGSAAASVVYSRRAWSLDAPARLVILSCSFGVSVALLGLSGAFIWQLFILILTGIAMGPTILTAYLLADTQVPPGRQRTHAAILASVAVNAGAALGLVIGGLTLDSGGASMTFLLFGCGTTTVSLAGWWGMRTERPTEAGLRTE